MKSQQQQQQQQQQQEQQEQQVVSNPFDFQQHPRVFTVAYDLGDFHDSMRELTPMALGHIYSYIVSCLDRHPYGDFKVDLSASRYLTVSCVVGSLDSTPLTRLSFFVDSVLSDAFADELSREEFEKVRLLDLSIIAPSLVRNGR